MFTKAGNVLQQTSARRFADPSETIYLFDHTLLTFSFAEYRPEVLKRGERASCTIGFGVMRYLRLIVTLSVDKLTSLV
jgi:hypothetical protein